MKQNRLSPYRDGVVNEASGVGVRSRAITLTPEKTPDRRIRVGKPRMAIATVAVAIGAVAAASTLGGDQSHIPAPTPPEHSVSEAELLRDWVNRGLVPEQALPDAEPISREDLLRDWVNRGLVPAATLD